MREAQWIADATVCGVMYLIDWYPAIILTKNSESKVFGEIYTIDEKTLAELDEYEGQEYRRVSVLAEDVHGEKHQTWIWEAREVPDRPVILSGDWLQR